MSRLLLCPPTHFDVTYEINPWMSMHNRVDHEKVKVEYEELKKIYENLGVDVLEIEQDPTLPDMVYATDFGIAINNQFVSANFKYPQRQKEAFDARKYFEEKGFEVKTFANDLFFEGGDLLKVNNSYFLGYGPRSSFEIAKRISNILEADVIPLELIDPYYFHLDTAFMPLNNDAVLIYLKAFTKEGLAQINRKFKKVFEATLEDSMLFACNGVIINNTLVIGKGISEELNRTFINEGLIVTEVPMDEYRKGGGSVRCLTLMIY